MNVHLGALSELKSDLSEGLTSAITPLHRQVVGILASSLRHGIGPLCIVMVTVLPNGAADPPVGD